MADSAITIRRGTNAPDITWKLMSKGVPFDGAGSSFVLTIVSGGVRLVRSTANSSDGLTYDSGTGTLRWQRTLADSRQIGLGRVGRYELERRFAGRQSFLASGAVVGVGSISDD